MLIRLLFAAAIVVSMAVTGCTTRPSTPSPVLSTVAITDFKSVAGKWGGLVKGMPPRGSSKDEDFVNVIITPDGAYDFGIYRTVGVFGGKGKLTLENGQIKLTGERGTATAVLLEGNGQRILRANGLLRNGVRLSADLTPIR